MAPKTRQTGLLWARAGFEVASWEPVPFKGHEPRASMVFSRQTCIIRHTAMMAADGRTEIPGGYWDKMRWTGGPSNEMPQSVPMRQVSAHRPCRPPPPAYPRGARLNGR